MNVKAIITIVLLLSSYLMVDRISQENNADFREGEYIHIKNIVIEFNGANATVDMEYQLAPFAKLYMFFFGSKNLKPKIEKTFSEFPETKIQKIGISSASLQLQNVSRKKDEYYLHDSRNLGIQTDVLTLTYSENGEKETKSIKHARATMDIFYKAGIQNNGNESLEKLSQLL